MAAFHAPFVVNYSFAAGSVAAWSVEPRNTDEERRQADIAAYYLSRYHSGRMFVMKGRLIGDYFQIEDRGEPE